MCTYVTSICQRSFGLCGSSSHSFAAWYKAAARSLRFRCSRPSAFITLYACLLVTPCPARRHITAIRLYPYQGFATAIFLTHSCTLGGTAFAFGPRLRRSASGTGTTYHRD